MRLSSTLSVPASGRMRVPQRALALVAVAAFSLTACGTSTPSSTPSGATHGPVRVSVARAISGLSPLGSSEYDLQTLGVIEMLGRPMDDTSGVEPNVLAGWTRTDTLTWQLAVRPGVTFQDGRKVDAQAIADAIAMVKANNKGATDTIATGTLTVSGPMQLTLVTAQPTTEVPWDLSDPTLYPVFDAAAVAAAGSDPAKLVAAGIFTGPWVPTSVTPQKLTFAANQHYWRGKPAVPGLEVDVITDAQARVSAVQNGELDVDLNPPPDAAKTLAGDSRVVYLKSAGTTVSSLALFNTHETPFDDPKVRQAIIAATDFSSLAATAGGNFVAAQGLFPPAVPYSVTTQAYDLAKAGSLLDGAGWKAPQGSQTRTKNGAPLTLEYVYSPAQGPGQDALAIAFKASLAKAGVDVSLKSVDNPYDAANRGPGWGMVVIGTNAEGDADPVDKSVGVFLGSGKPYNMGGVSDTAVDAALAGLADTLDPNQRQALARSFEQAVASGGYGMSLGFTALDAVVAPAYKNYRVPFDPGYVPWDIHPAT